jgi:hypothetical protein
MVSNATTRGNSRELNSEGWYVIGFRVMGGSVGSTAIPAAVFAEALDSLS